MNFIERAKAPTPKIFRILRSVGLALLAISGSVIAAPVVMPVAVVTVAGYVAVAGGVISALSQITVDLPPPLSPLKGGQNTDLTNEKDNLNRARDGD